MTEALPKSPEPSTAPHAGDDHLKEAGITASRSTNEAQRLEALQRYKILDTPREAAFDRITALAARLFDVPIALVSLIDASRGWFKSSYGFDQQEVERDNTICSLAILTDTVLVIPDTRQDDRLLCNPFVQSEPGLRFYAGAPLLTHDGFNLGTLCLLDIKPRDALTAEQAATLSDLAAMVVDELELRLAAHKIAQIDAALLEVSHGVSTVTGEAFFPALVQHLTTVLGIDYAYIGLVSNGLVSGAEQAMIHTIAACAKGQLIDNFAYPLQGTPCEMVFQQRKLCSYPSGVQTLFPNAPLLKPLAIESYVAIPFFDLAGAPLGLLGVMDGKPLENMQVTESLLTIFALRIVTELERQQAEVARQQARRDLEQLVAQRTAELSSANQLLQLEVSERQQAEIALQKEQELLRVLLDHVQAGIVACDADGMLTLFNWAARDFHGLPEQPLPPDQWAEQYDLYLPDGKTPMLKEAIPLFRALQGQPVENVEMVIAPRQGAVRTLLASGQAIADQQGNKQGAVVVMHDITERKQAEAELLISDAALQQMPDAILLTDLDGTIQRWLGNAEQIFGYTAAEAIGQPVSFLHHPELKDTIATQMIQSLQTKGVFCGEVSCVRKDSTAVAIETTSKPVYDQAGKPLFFVGINKNIAERKQAEAERAQLMRQQVQEQTARLEAEADRQQAAFLAEISTVLSSSLDYEQTLAIVAALVVPFFADWCAIDLLRSEQAIERVAVAHSDPEKVALGWDLHRRYPSQIDAAEGVPKVLRTGKTEMAVEILDEALAAAMHEPEHLQILRALGLKSYIISPLTARGQILGAISFVMAESGRRYSPVDLALAQDLAHRASIAIDNARLYQEAQQAQRDAEQFANRTAVLQRITAALSQALTPQQVSEVVMKQGIAALGATAGSIALLDEQGASLEILQAVGYPASVLSQWSSLAVDAPVPLAETVRTGEPLFLEAGDAFFARYPQLVDGIATTGHRAFACLPLAAEGRLIGVMGLSFGTLQAFDLSDRTFMLTLAQQCAQAIARAHLYEAERIARNDAVREATRSAEANRIKDEFLAVLSHELRTPLNPILGWSSLLRSGKLDAEKTEYALETIERNAKLQTQLIEDLLDVSRILQGKLNLKIAPVNLTATIQAAMETVRLAAVAKSIHLQPLFESGGLVLGDAARLQQVVWNLLTNAVKFTPAGGRVEIKLSCLKGHAHIQVIDTGEGIHADFLPHVFEYFRQADGSTTRQFGGLGLGLAIVHHLVELHGGTVQVNSSGENQGTTFTVKLPLLEKADEISTDATALSPQPPSPLSGVRILLVDDDSDARTLTAFILEQAGAIATAVGSVVEALAIVPEIKPDVLISDIGMPNSDGYELIQRFRAMPTSHGRHIPAIALTAYAGEINQRQALAAGFQRHLSKPVDPAALVTAIANLLIQPNAEA